MGPQERTSRIAPDWLESAALILALSVVTLLSLFPVHSFDLWWHLRTGELILEEGRIPDTDPFTYTAHDHPWITHEWLSEVLFQCIYKVGGADLLVIVKALVLTLAVALAACAGLVGRRGLARHGIPAAALAILLSGPLLAPRAFVRPHLLTALLLGATLLLLRLDSASGRRRYRWALVPVFALWSNLHSGFTLGLALILLYWIGEHLIDARHAEHSGTHRPQWKSTSIAFGIIVLATFLNPHHVEALLYPLRLLERSEVRNSIAEFRSIFHPAFRGALFLKVLAASTVLLGATVAAARRRPQWSLLLPTAACLLLALSTVRTVSEFAIMLPAAFTAHGMVMGKHRMIARAVLFTVIAVSLAGAAGALLWGQPMGHESNRRVGLGIHPTNRPDIAARFMKELAPPGRMFNLLGFGGYLIHEVWPERRVFIDGRLDVFPPGFLDAYNHLLASGTGWAETVQKYDLRFAIVDYGNDPEHDHGLRGLLRNDPTWRCVCFGDNVVIYARECVQNHHLLSDYGTPFDPSLRSARSIEAFASTATKPEREQAIQALDNIAAFAADQIAPSYVLGRILLRSGRGGEAVGPLRRAAHHDRALPDTRRLLAQALMEADSLDAARLEVAALMKREPRDCDLLLLYADVERRAGNPLGAADALTQVVRIAPQNFIAQLHLGIMRAELGDYAAARRSFEAARRLRPTDSSVHNNLQMLERMEKENQR